MAIFKRNIKPREPKEKKPSPAVARERAEVRIIELETELEFEKLEHKNDREKFAKEIAAVNKSFGDGDRAAFNDRMQEKDALIDAFIVEVTKLLPSSALVRKARELRGII